MELFANLGGVATGFCMSDQVIDCVCGTELIKLDRRTGEITARRTVFEKEGLARCMAAGGGQIAVSDFCELRLFDQDTFEPIARLKLGNDLSTDICALTCTDARVYASIRNGKLIALERGTLAQTARDVSGASMWCVLPHEGELLCGTVDGHALALDPITLAEKRRVRLDTQNIRSLWADGGTLYAASQSKKLFKLDLYTFETRDTARGAHARMFDVAGRNGDTLVTVCHPGGEIALWDAQTLSCTARIRENLKLSGVARIQDGALYCSSRSLPGIGRMAL